MNEELEKIKAEAQQMLGVYMDNDSDGVRRAMEIIDQAFQAGKSSTIAKIRDRMPKKRETGNCPNQDHKGSTVMGHTVVYDGAIQICHQCSANGGFNQAVDLMEKNITDVEGE